VTARPRTFTRDEARRIAIKPRGQQATAGRAPANDDQICYVAVTALTSVSAKMRPGFERRGMSVFKGVVASTDHFDSTFQAAADTNGVAIGIRRIGALACKKQKFVLKTQE